MQETLHTFRYLTEFQCLGAECADTCCKGWGMQLDPLRYALYQKEAPELLEAVTSGEAERILKRDPVTDYCVKFDTGLCGIHKTRGTAFLGDACHFYPRITRKFGEAHTQAATLSCPEITRLVLYGEHPFAAAQAQTDRIPVEIKSYLPEGLKPEEALALQQQFMAACDAEGTPEHLLMQIVSAAFSLKNIKVTDWPGATGLMLRLAGSQLPPAEVDFNDGYLLIQILEALLGASKPTARPRLDETRRDILKALSIQIAANDYSIVSQSGDFGSYRQLWNNWQPNRAQMAPILKRWLKAQLAMAGFPFAGFGADIAERAVFLAVRFATLRLALMSAPSLEEENILRIVQSLSRFMDHLADPEFSRIAYTEAGWFALPRLRGLVLDL